jgi:small subunit ribosomal protein S18
MDETTFMRRRNKQVRRDFVNAQTPPFFVLENFRAKAIIFRSMTETDPEQNADRQKNADELTILDDEPLSRYVTDTGKILPRKYTRLSPKQQRRISRLIKKGRHMQTLK